jgi:thiol-disulfide isomerase/thioredoxin
LGPGHRTLFVSLDIPVSLSNMKKLFSVAIIILLSVRLTQAQDAILDVAFTNSTAKTVAIWQPSHTVLQGDSFDIQLNAAKSGSHTFKIIKPEFIHLLYRNNNADTTKWCDYLLYLSPGDHMSFKANFQGKYNGVQVTGKGYENNQPLLSAPADTASVQPMYGDTLPTRIIAFANKHQADMRIALNEYVKRYKPSADFIKNEDLNISYDAVCTYYDFKGNNKFNNQQAFARNYDKWTRIQDSLFATIKLNNDDALTAVNYTGLIKTFLGREKERLWDLSRENPVAFYKEWYNSDIETGEKLLMADEQNLLKEKIINHYFTNRSAELLYTKLFDDAIDEHNPKNIILIFDNFKKQHPNSDYVKLYQPIIDSIKERSNHKLTADMVFVKDNGTTLNTFDDLLAITKGKTVLLDMWGTWCAPCRNEINDNGPAIKAYFKDKGLDYYYVANFDSQNEDEWKILIAYFDMKGTHILANQGLTYDIMRKVKGSGYPTYIIIKKDGTYELSKAGFPMNRQVLIKQLEEALKN